MYYLNFKPEQDAQWQELADLYTEETGVEVTVLTAASGSYETTLKSEMAKTDAPTLFQVNGPVGLASWKDYCYDLTGSAVVQPAHQRGLRPEGQATQMYGIGYVIETYGIIVQQGSAGAGRLHPPDDITNFADAQEGCRGHHRPQGRAWASPLSPPPAWTAPPTGASRPTWPTCPSTMSIRLTASAPPTAIKGTYLDNYQAIWDLYINNATCAPAELCCHKTGDDAVAEFVNGEGRVLSERHLGLWRCFRPGR
ncbi:MAG: extracellular solute-binding protein [Dysosmobacter sp.]